MSKSTEWRPRVCADVNEDTYATLRKYIPSGQQRTILAFLMDDLAEMLKENPAEVLTAILLRDLGTKGILKLDIKIKEALNE